MKKLFSNFKYLKFNDFFSFFIFLFALPFALVFKITHKDYWIVSESPDTASDNGYWFFKYVKENHPQQKICYAITKNSHERHKVEGLGKVINYGSFKHYIYYLGSSKKISSQKGSKPNAALFYFFEIYGILKNKRYFLQHGIIINDTKWLYYKNSKFKLFVCGAEPEYDFVKQYFGYPDNNVQYLGLCRHDNLHNQKIKENQILLMPTWRSWIARDYLGNKNKQSFLETDYYKHWSKFLNSEQLWDILEQNNKTLVFYPHYNMQQFLQNFQTKCNRIVIASKRQHDVQTLLMESQLLITDYSSVFLDFAYMKKPIVFYQFDYTDFFKKQYDKGYFDYKTSHMGVWSDNLTDTLANINNIIKNDCNLTKEALLEIENFFPLYDTNNCQRNYNAIKHN